MYMLMDYMYYLSLCLSVQENHGVRPKDLIMAVKDSLRPLRPCNIQT